MSLFPIFVKMAQRPALVVGGGALAVAKVEALMAAEAEVTVVAGEVCPEISDQRRLRWICRDFDANDVRGKAIVFAATGERETDRRVFVACREAGVLCNAVDDPEFCDFYSPAIVRRGDLQIAISTNGQSPALAQQIRRELEVRFDADWSDRVAELGRKRRLLLATIGAGRGRNEMLHAQASAAMRTQDTGFLRRFRTAVWKWLNTEDKRVPLI